MATLKKQTKKSLLTPHSVLVLFLEGQNQLQKKYISTFGKYYTIYTHKMFTKTWRGPHIENLLKHWDGNRREREGEREKRREGEKERWMERFSVSLLHFFPPKSFFKRVSDKRVSSHASRRCWAC